MKNGSLPSNADAEKGILSSLLISPREVFNLCAAANVDERIFYVPANATIFRAIIEMVIGNIPLDFVTLSNRLRAADELDRVGGAVAISALFVYLPTAANVGDYIEIVAGCAARRRALLVADEIKTRIADCEEIGEIAALMRQTGEELAAPGGGLLTRLRAQAFDSSAVIPKPEPIFALGDATISTPGNLLGISAAVKAGKSAFVGAMLAATFGADGDTLGLRAANHGCRAVLHFDCEQSRYDHDSMVRRALRRVAVEQPPDWLLSYWLTGWTLGDRRMAIRVAFEFAARRFKGVHSALIDGLADLCADPNDSAEAFALIDDMHQLAIEFDTVIGCVIHENPGTEIGKTRGHLGSQLERKAETNLRLAKDSDGVTVIFCDRARHAHIPKDKGTCFAWDDDAGMHLSTGAVADAKRDAKRAKIAVLVEQMFDDGDGLGMGWEQCHKAIEKVEGCKRSTARLRFDSALELGLLTKKSERYWPQTSNVR